MVDENNMEKQFVALSPLSFFMHGVSGTGMLSGLSLVVQVDT